MKKKRDKKYKGPKYVAMNPALTFLGGMSGQHREEMQKLMYWNHSALAVLSQGQGTKDDWGRVIGAVNMANVMCEQGLGKEFREQCRAARNAMCEIGKRFHQVGKFVFEGEELQSVSEALACHDAQIENSRYIDIERAADEVMRRIRHKINSTTVREELEKEAA